MLAKSHENTGMCFDDDEEAHGQVLTVTPKLLEELFTLLCAVVESVLVGKIVRKSGKGCHPMFVVLWV